MRARYENSAELGWKIDSEGGLCEMLFGYGLHVEELPHDLPDEIRRLIGKLLSIQWMVEEVEQYFCEAVATYQET